MSCHQFNSPSLQNQTKALVPEMTANTDNMILELKKFTGKEEKSSRDPGTSFIQIFEGIFSNEVDFSIGFLCKLEGEDNPPLPEEEIFSFREGAMFGSEGSLDCFKCNHS